MGAERTRLLIGMSVGVEDDNASMAIRAKELCELTWSEAQNDTKLCFDQFHAEMVMRREAIREKIGVHLQQTVDDAIFYASEYLQGRTVPSFVNMSGVKAALRRGLSRTSAGFSQRILSTSHHSSEL